MALLFKTDVTYTGVAEAKHILELLSTAQDKLDYANIMLESIGATSSYITTANIDAVIAKLMTHIRNIQSKGAQALSLPYTLKAIIFIMQNSLIDTEFMAVSPDFGITYDSVNKYATKLYSLNGGVFSAYSTPRMELDKFNGVNVLRQWDESVSACAMVSDAAILLSKGLIIGKCINQTAESPLAAESLILHNMSSFNEILLVKTNLVRTTGAASATMYVPVATATTGTSKAVSGQPKDAFRLSGVVNKYEYSTNLNKLFSNGVELIANTDANLMFNASAFNARVEIQSTKVTDGVVEAWVINSKDDVLAQNLSTHLNRQNMLNA